MRILLKTLFSCLFGMLMFTSAQSQQWVEQVFVLNEGYYNFGNDSIEIPVTLGSYDPSTGNYTVVAAIDGARFASDVIVEGDFVYVAADKYLIKYHRDTYAEVARITLPGIRKLAAYKDQLLVTRGDVVKFASYFHVYEQSDLSLAYTLDTASTGIKYASEGITIDGDSAFIAVNNGFDPGNQVGLLAVVNLINEEYVHAIDLGGNNPDNVMRDGFMIYTLNNEDYSTSSISMYDIVLGTMQNFSLQTVSACNGSFFANEKVYYQAAYIDTVWTPDLNVSRFDPLSWSIEDTISFGKSFYGMDYDPINNKMYAATTNYVSEGMVFIYGDNNLLEDSFAVSTSPGTFAFDVRGTTGLSISPAQITIEVYPNPMKDLLFVNWSGAEEAHITISTLLGQQLIDVRTNKQHEALNVSGLAAGIYMLELRTSEGLSIQKLIK